MCIWENGGRSQEELWKQNEGQAIGSGGARAVFLAASQAWVQDPGLLGPVVPELEWVAKWGTLGLPLQCLFPV